MLNLMDLIRGLFRGYQRARRCVALPCAVDLDPRICEPLAVHVRLTFLRTLYSKGPYNYCRIPANLHVALFGHCLRRLISRRLDTGQEFTFGGGTPVYID